MKRLLLLGGGHAQLAVLADLARQPLGGWSVTLVTPYRRQIYSGMLPGWVAGHYPIEACAIALDRLAGHAGVHLQTGLGSAIDLPGRRLHGADGSVLPFDALSIDTGPVADLAALPGAEAHALPVRPIERFVDEWPRLAERMAAARAGFRLQILGGGAAGVELALAIRQRATAEGWRLAIDLVGAGDAPLPGTPRAAQAMAARLLAERSIVWHGGRRAEALTAGRLHLNAGPTLPFDACIVATGAAAPDWPAASGLALDGSGFIAVGATLQSRSHPNVFAAGDVAALPEPRPKSGVYAVRAGPVLAANLRAFCTGQPLQRWQPQRRALYLVSTGDRQALALWGPLAWRGPWVWRWKDRIDRGFMQRFGSDAAGVDAG